MTEENAAEDKDKVRIVKGATVESKKGMFHIDPK